MLWFFLLSFAIIYVVLGVVDLLFDQRSIHNIRWGWNFALALTVLTVMALMMFGAVLASGSP